MRVREGVAEKEMIVNRSPAATTWLNRAEAAERCRVPVSTFDKLRREGAIPQPDAQMGKHLLWRVETIDELLATGGTRREGSG